MEGVEGVSIAVTLLPLLVDLLKKHLRDISTVKKLLKNEIEGAALDGVLKMLLDEMEGWQLPDDVSHWQKGLYLRLKGTCTQLSKTIEISRHDYQRRRHSLAKRIYTYEAAFRKLRKLHADYLSVVELIGQSNALFEFKLVYVSLILSFSGLVLLFLLGHR